MAHKTKENKKDNKIKDFFNNPRIIIVTLIVVCFLLLFIMYMMKENSTKFYYGDLIEDEVGVQTIHCITNKKINYFYSTSAGYLSDDTDVYKYEIGYYVMDKNGNKIDFLKEEGALDEKTSLKAIVSAKSSFDVAEYTTDQAVYFKQDVVKNIDNLYFYIKASTSSDSNDYDIDIEKKVNLVKVV